MHPVLVTIGPIQIRFYGLMYVMAILVGYFLVKSEVKRRDMDLTPDDVMNFIFWVVLGGVIGARIYYVVFNWEYYWPDLREIVAIWHGGLAIHGGILGGLAAGFVYTRRKRIPFLRGADVVAPSLILGQAFGRLGNFINGELFGRPSNLPWAMVFPMGGPEPRHPSQLYEAALEGLLLFVVLWMLKDRPFRPGTLVCLFLGGYGVVRFLVEFFRQPDPQIGLVWGLLSVGQILCLAMIIAAAILWKFLPQDSPAG